VALFLNKLEQVLIPIPSGSRVNYIFFSVSSAASKSGKETIVNLAEHSDHAEGTDVHSLIGVALVLGFVFMLLVDQISAKRGI
jgi:hypothetical protein